MWALKQHLVSGLHVSHCAAHSSEQQQKSAWKMSDPSPASLRAVAVTTALQPHSLKPPTATPFTSGPLNPSALNYLPPTTQAVFIRPRWHPPSWSQLLTLHSEASRTHLAQGLVHSR